MIQRMAILLDVMRFPPAERNRNRTRTQTQNKEPERQCLHTTLSLALSSQELQNQLADLLRLFLLDPVASAFDELEHDHPGAGGLPHAVDRSGSLIHAPVALPRDEGGRHVDRPA